MDIENEYEGKVVLVTGGAGCIGTNLCRKLAELNAEKVIILDDLSSAYEWNIPKAKNIVFVRGSVLDDEMLKRVFKFKEKPDYVFHLAAHFANQNSVDNPEIDLMVDIALPTKGVAGAQLAGAGLGGCMMVLAQEEAVDRLMARMTELYYCPRGLRPTMSISLPIAGSGVLLKGNG